LDKILKVFAKNGAVQKHPLIIKASKPDTIPPSASIFADYYVSETGIRINWIKSTSNDVEKVELMRKTDGQELQKVIAFDENKSEFTDKGVKEDVVYDYSLWTWDDAKNLTVSSKPLRLKALKSYILKSTPTITAVKDKAVDNLTITYATTENMTFVVYRAIGENPLTTFKIVSTLAVEDDFPDKALLKYAVKAIDNEGRESTLSKEVIVDTRN